VSLGRTAEKHIPGGSLIVVAGQRLGASIWVPAQYFSSIKIYSISYDVQTKGEADWRARLCTAIRDAAIINKTQIAVVSDLMGKPTKGGLALAGKGYDRPNLWSMQAFFRRWHIVHEWEDGGFNFLVVEPPDDFNTIECGAPADAN
jgi:hypothetical protein